MVGFAIRTAITALGLWLASELVSGIHIGDGRTLVIAALGLGFVNAVVRPVLVLFTLPFTVLTLGLFLFVINAGMLGLVASFLSSFEVAGFGSALLGSLIVSATSWVASWYVGPKGRVEVLIIERRAH
jgi:putative membrane protein